MTTTPPSTRSTSEARRPVVVAHAVARFAEGGLSGTTVADVAASAGISTAYVLKLFPTKELLFLAALEECFDRIEQTLIDAVSNAGGGPETVLTAMGEAYARMIADRDLLMLQVHAQSATTAPAIRNTLRARVQRVTDLVSARSGAGPQAVQYFMAMGQLCHLVVTLDIESVDAPWAELLTLGLRHYDETMDAATTAAQPPD